MSEEIKKEAQNMELSKEALDKVAGGKIDYNPGNDREGEYVIVDDNEGEVKTWDDFVKAKFYASGVCPRCGKTFASKSDIENHINGWASGQN